MDHAAMHEENLWGDLPAQEQIETPLDILKQQAALLGGLTRGMLEGQVVSQPTYDPAKFMHELRIVAPALMNYSVPIVSTLHGLSLYPAEVFQGTAVPLGPAHNAEEFKALLKKALQSAVAKSTIAALMTQSATAAPSASHAA